MRAGLLVLPVLAMALAGCGSRTTFVRPDANMADQRRDVAQCEYEIQMGQQQGIRYPWWYNNNQALGYTIGAAIGIAIRNDQLRNLCMQAKGYTPILLSSSPVPVGEPQPNLPAVSQPPAYAEAPRPTAVAVMTPAPAPPVGAAPSVAGLKGESKYMSTAEGVAKASACNPPNAAMTSKGAGMEMFAVACPNGTTMAIRCEIDGCRILR